MSTAHNMAIAAPALSQVQMIRHTLFSVPGVQRVFVKQRGGDAYSVLVVLPDMERETERAVFSKEEEIIGAFPDTDFDFDMVFLCGRQLHDIVSPSGKEVFATR